MAPGNLNFIVIDDSKLDCFIAEKIIRNTGRGEVVKSFIMAPEALDYISNGGGAGNTLKTVMLVDIQMPVMNGFEFIEAFEKLPQEIRDKYIIYVLSSSINENDITRVRYHTSVKQFLNKPLTSNTLSTILELIE
jgi:CheY-like chemotaxis protein